MNTQEALKQSALYFALKYLQTHATIEAYTIAEHFHHDIPLTICNHLLRNDPRFLVIDTLSAQYQDNLLVKLNTQE